MAIFNDTKADSGAGGKLKPGRYLVEVDDAIEKESKKGDPMILLSLKAIKTGKFCAYDNIMLDGGGAGIGKAKLSGFGIAVKNGDEVTAKKLIGKRALAHLKEEVYEGKTKLAVDIEQGEHCGYDIEGAPIEGEPVEGFESIPF